MKRTKKCGFENGLGELEKTLLRIDGNLVFLCFIRRRSDWIVKTPRESQRVYRSLRHLRHVNYATETSRYVKNATEITVGRKSPTDFGQKSSTTKRKALVDLTSKKKLKGQIKLLDGQRTKMPLSARKNPPRLVTIFTNV